MDYSTDKGSSDKGKKDKAGKRAGSANKSKTTQLAIHQDVKIAPSTDVPEGS